MTRMPVGCSWFQIVLVVLAGSLFSNVQGEDARRLTYAGYPECIELTNGTTRVILCPAAGGRVLEFSWSGQNALYLDAADSGNRGATGKAPEMSAGRFDIGPEKAIPPHPRLWSGPWSSEVTGPRSAVLTSVNDEATGTQLRRAFELDEQGSRLRCTQTIRNISQRTTEWCHWSRTFALGNGVGLIPLTSPSRFPNHYVMYEEGDRINFRPTDSQIRVRGGFLEILGVPRQPKLGMDSTAGWFAYLTRANLMFIKRFPVSPDRVYNEVAGLTISIWYPADRRVELEPIGPRERLAPGQSASFTEEWFLVPFAFPMDGQAADLTQVDSIVKGLPK